MYLGSNTLLDSEKTSTLTTNGGLQNPLYAAPGGVKPSTLPTSAKASSGHYDQLNHSRPTSEHKEDVVIENQEKEEPHYEILEPRVLTPTDSHYQKLADASLDAKEGALSNGAYASLYKVPPVIECPPQTPPRPPQLMPPTAGGARPENPYIIRPQQTSANGDAMTTNSPTTPEKPDLAKEHEETGKHDLKKL